MAAEDGKDAFVAKDENYDIPLAEEDVNIFVGRLQTSTTVDDLKTYFSQFGEVVNASIPQFQRGEILDT